MKKALTINPEECRGCRICELICSFTKEREFNPKKSCIRILRNEWKASYTPVVCLQCSTLICATVCPAQAIKREKRTGAVIVNQDKCTHCRLCARACPIGAININRENEPYVCDLCKGKPKCVEWCPVPGAIRYDTSSQENKKEVLDHLRLVKKTFGRQDPRKA